MNNTQKALNFLQAKIGIEFLPITIIEAIADAIMKGARWTTYLDEDLTDEMRIELIKKRLFIVRKSKSGTTYKIFIPFSFSAMVKKMTILNSSDRT